MNTNKIYAVKKGNKIGIFYNWEDCQKSILGYPNAEYKSFKTLQEAKYYLLNAKNNVIDKNNKKEIKKYLLNQYVVCFIDGSYDDNIKRFGFGSVILELINNELKKTFLSESYHLEEFLESRNVSGEIFGVIKTIEWCINNNVKKVVFFYDYIGIEKWATNQWKAETKIAKYYSEFMNKNFNLFEKIEFEKVLAHSGIKYNELADKLAKESLKN